MIGSGGQVVVRVEELVVDHCVALLVELSARTDRVVVELDRRVHLVVDRV